MPTMKKTIALLILSVITLAPLAAIAADGCCPKDKAAGTCPAGGKKDTCPKDGAKKECCPSKQTPAPKK